MCNDFSTTSRIELHHSQCKQGPGYNLSHRSLTRCISLSISSSVVRAPSLSLCLPFPLSLFHPQLRLPKTAAIRATRSTESKCKAMFSLPAQRGMQESRKHGMVIAAVHCIAESLLDNWLINTFSHITYASEEQLTTSTSH